jgi:hypothetical protein
VNSAFRVEIFGYFVTDLREHSLTMVSIWGPSLIEREHPDNILHRDATFKFSLITVFMPLIAHALAIALPPISSLPLDYHWNEYSSLAQYCQW